MAISTQLNDIMNHNDGIKSQHLNFYLTIDSIMKFLNVDFHNYGMSNSDYNYEIKVGIIRVMIDVPFYLNMSISTSVFFPPNFSSLSQKT